MMRRVLIDHARTHHSATAPRGVSRTCANSPTRSSPTSPPIERLPGSTEARQAVLTQSLKYLDSPANEAAGDLQLSRLARRFGARRRGVDRID
jgi:hypothetical protein